MKDTIIRMNNWLGKKLQNALNGIKSNTRAGELAYVNAKLGPLGGKGNDRFLVDPRASGMDAVD